MHSPDTNVKATPLSSAVTAAGPGPGSKCLSPECVNALGRQMIREGLITSPGLVRALHIQQELLKRTGTYRLLGEIIEDEIERAEVVGGSPAPIEAID